MKNNNYCEIKNNEVHLYTSCLERSPVDNELTERQWANFMTGWQKLPTQNEPFTSIHIHLEQCRWLDPIPLISILTEIYHLRDCYDCVNIYFQEFAYEKLKKLVTNVNDRKSQDELFKKYRFLRFLASQEVFEQLSNKNINLLFGGEIFKASFVSKKILEVTSYFHLSYERSELVPLQIIEVPNINKNRNFPAETTESLLDVTAAKDPQLFAAVSAT